MGAVATWLNSKQTLGESSLWLTLAAKTYLHTAVFFVCVVFVFFFSSSLQTDLLKIMLEGGEERADPSLNTLLAHNKGILPILVPAAETEKKYCCLLAIFPDSGGHLYTC